MATATKKEAGPTLYVIDSEAMVCQEAVLRGEVTVGKGTVIHPTCLLDAKVGPIRVGADNILEEQVEIVNTTPEALTIGDRNVIEVGAKIVGAKAVGNSNILETKCFVGEGVEIHNGCTVGVASVVPDGVVMKDESVIFGPNSASAKEPGAAQYHDLQMTRHLEILRETLPKSHYLKRNKKEEEERDKERARERKERDKEKERERERAGGKAGEEGGGSRSRSERDREKERGDRSERGERSEREKERSPQEVQIAAGEATDRDRERDRDRSSRRHETSSSAAGGGSSSLTESQRERDRERKSTRGATSSEARESHRESASTRRSEKEKAPEQRRSSASRTAQPPPK
uniref:Dynactin subunit 6 n=1 Tax=Chromera velia CCMP2878 TaxID=1169474 RepID=A0A0G4I9Z1_9ALVE|eukprot:Cvel_2073.t1-p1 / transcript=Cvel_2073.t1 / gene=Cvel_2073 / organism=Chromera_velia_CCMP2878 / gene_product=Dynactin subunit 6, putative / transcript_product=Dynactin subunit 6, putative / location=Cvel_scaffold80:33037-35916(+) / protein_length=345 / sequence_SO=supercontig / SO=protein_coding / is_pseudo=false